MVRCLVLALALGGCFQDRYRCASDEDCDLGVAGRCELDGACTQYDLTCDTHRRYSPHAGALTGQCFDDRIAPVNPCTGGQPPARPDGCYAQVCDSVPACCELGWTNLCAQLAEQLCEVTCDTRIAVTATRNTTIERFELDWLVDHWAITRRDDLGEPFMWVAPAPGESEPRLAGTAGGELIIGDTHLPALGVCTSLTSIDFDRDGRDTIVASYDNSRAEIWKLSERRARQTAGTTAAMIWGDVNRDAFPDAVARSTTQYAFLDDVEDPDTHGQQLLRAAVGNVTGGSTPGAAPVRSIDWLDFDRDHKLDLVVFGSSVRIHTTPDGLSDISQRDLDCEPPSATRPCATDPEPNLEAYAFGGAGMPSVSDPSLVISSYPGRKLYRARASGSATTVEPLAFPGDTCTCTPACTMCPGPDCSCTYDCSACPMVEAVVVRDLDGDHALDLVAIDAKLRVYVALAATGFTWSAPTQIETPLPASFATIDVSVAGAPRP